MNWLSPASGSVTVAVPLTVNTSSVSVSALRTEGSPSTSVKSPSTLMVAGSFVPVMLMVTVPLADPSLEVTVKVSTLRAPKLTSGLTV